MAVTTRRLAMNVTTLLLLQLIQGILAITSSSNPSYIGSYTALGDSYAAGDGVGSSKLLPNFDSLCGRFDGAYPFQVANNTKLQIDPFGFENIACGGSVSKTVLKSQIPKITTSDVVTIQVGGNEVDFFLVLNECIQQWHPLSSCDEEINRARGLIESTKFIGDFDRMVSGGRDHLKPGATFFILGYAKFFNDKTHQCNSVTFSKTDPDNFLTNDLRKKLNDLVVLLNGVIEASARAHGVIYLDTDQLFEGHRFCEEGVIEPHPDLEGTWFFRETPRRNENPLLRQLRLGMDLHVESNPFKDFLDLTKTFHPTAQGHEAIAAAIVNETLRYRRDSMKL